jgi:hypothetical protein
MNIQWRRLKNLSNRVKGDYQISSVPYYLTMGDAFGSKGFILAAREKR